jgi:CRP-like cAMP-binding protein
VSAIDVTARLREVSFLEGVDDETLSELAGKSARRTFSDGARLVSELEPGADVFVVLAGKAEVSVEARKGHRDVLRTLGPGDAFGEMSSLTGELRSATVIARGKVEALVIPDALFDRLRERRPQVAVALVRVLASRLAETERAVDSLLASSIAPPSEVKKTAPKRGSVVRVWQELVVNRKRDLAFLTLASFVITLLLVRSAVWVSFTADFAPRMVLRGAYLTGFALLLGSAAVALLTFRPSLRRLVAIAYGVGGALVLNELGVTLAFDIFYKDIHTPDPNVPFDIERLYRRAEPLRGIAIGLVILIQAAYLRGFYARLGFILKTKVRALLSRK